MEHEQYPAIFESRRRQEVWCIEDPEDVGDTSSLSECGSFFSNVNSFFHSGGGTGNGSPSREASQNQYGNTEEIGQEHHEIFPVELTQPYDLRRDVSYDPNAPQEEDQYHNNNNATINDEGYAVDYGQQRHYQTPTRHYSRHSQLQQQQLHVDEVDEAHLFPDELQHGYELRRNHPDTFMPYADTGYVDDLPQQHQNQHAGMLLYDKHQDYEKLNGSSHNTLTDESTVDEYYEDNSGHAYYNDQNHHHTGSNSSTSSSSDSSKKKKPTAVVVWYRRRWFIVLTVIAVASVIGFCIGRRFGSSWKSSKDDFQSLNFNTDDDNNNNNTSTREGDEDSTQDTTSGSFDGADSTTTNTNATPSPSTMPTTTENDNVAPDNNVPPTSLRPTLQPTGKPTTMRPTTLSPSTTSPTSQTSPTVPVLIVSPTTKQPTLPPTPTTQSPTDVVVAPLKPPEPEVFPVQSSGEYFSDIESGPMVGHTTYHSATLWAYHGGPDASTTTMLLAYAPSNDVSQTQVVDMPPRSTQNNAALATIYHLTPNTRYSYELRMADSTSIGGIKVIARGHFKTAPPQPPLESTSTSTSRINSPVKFDYLLTSCMNIEAHKGYPEQPVWDHVLEKNPDFSIMAGDTVYLTEEDWTSDTREVIYDRVWYRNMKQRSDPHFARVIGSFPTYAAWDDHEYGSNNAEKNQPGKDNSLKAFRDVWANPGYGTPEIRGNFYDYYWGDVHFIVLDNRWYRDRNQQTQLGSAQKNWLYDKLRNSRGTFKVIVSGCDIMEAGYGRDVDEIGRVVRDNNIYGVIFNAGDIHRNEFKQMENGNWPYPVTQYSSSGIARDNWMRPWSIIKVNTELADPEITAHFYGADSEALNSTWSNDPNLRCSSIQEVDLSKEARCTETIRLSDLTPSTVQVSDTLLFPPEKPGDIDKPTGPISNIDFSKTNFTVGTYYYPWYGDTSFNGRNYLRAELSPPQYPTLGEYDQRNEEVITQHLKWSEQANINLWVTSWWGPDSATNRNTLAITNNGYLAESKIKLALFYETKGRIPANGDVGNVYGDIAYAAENYFNNPNYYKIDGRPVFYIYLARWLHDIGKLDDAVNEMRRAARDKGFNIYIVGDMAHSAPPQGYYAPFDWLDAITEYDVFGSMGRPDYAGDDNRVEFYRNKQENWRQAARGQNCDFMPSITPGYNDKGVRNQPYASMSRKLTRNSEFGSLFQALLNNAVGQVDIATGNAFMVTSFNEWHEDTQIEPIVGDLTNQPSSRTSGKEYEAYGTRYLDILREGTKRTGVSVEPQKRY
mmetsp:Transcript_2693/g.3817  ORF Transcript_2693/g.3817 Transcript_2693/m.3817 type:complete len:1282 (-) Transcript_2693:194-4039(-)